MVHRPTIRALLCGAAAALTLAQPASAGTLQVDPIRVDIAEQRRSASVVVRNMEPGPVTIRAYPLGWSQADGDDVYSETGAVIVSPPVFTIPGGGSQTVRVGLRPGAGGAQAYRLMIEEVPEANPGGGVQVALRLNLPLFAMLKPGAAADLGWSARRGPDGRWQIEAANRGTGYVRVEPEQASAATGLRFPAGTGFGVVLPGGSRVWALSGAPDIADAARFQSLQRTAGDGQAQLARRAE
jgi:fimbrial chaperone protein